MSITASGADVPSETVDRGGRPPGRALTPREARTVRNLVAAKHHADDTHRRAAEQLENYVLGLRDTGASNRGISLVVGVAHSTVQGWVNNARRRRRNNK